MLHKQALHHLISQLQGLNFSSLAGRETGEREKEKKKGKKQCYLKVFLIKLIYLFISLRGKT